MHSVKSVITMETLQVLWLDALRMAKTLAAGFANLLQLFEQRSTIYPNDSNMEKLPERTILVGIEIICGSFSEKAFSVVFVCSIKFS